MTEEVLNRRARPRSTHGALPARRARTRAPRSIPAPFRMFPRLPAPRVPARESCRTLCPSPPARGRAHEASSVWGGERRLRRASLEAPRTTGPTGPVSGGEDDGPNVPGGLGKSAHGYYGPLPRVGLKGGASGRDTGPQIPPRPPGDLPLGTTPRAGARSRGRKSPRRVPGRCLKQQSHAVLPRRPPSPRPRTGPNDTREPGRECGAGPMAPAPGRLGGRRLQDPGRRPACRGAPTDVGRRGS